MTEVDAPEATAGDAHKKLGHRLARFRTPRGSSAARRVSRLLMALLLVQVLVACNIERAAHLATPVPEIPDTTTKSGALLDEFEGPAGSPPNPDYWVFDVGPSSVKGWEQGSVQTYTDSPQNVRLDGEGHLIIQARDDNGEYTSGRITTRGKINFGNGRISARIKFPAGQGLWPAFWMLGSNIEEVGWPESGEIDIMEIVNVGDKYNISLHGPRGDVSLRGPVNDLTEGFHVYWADRTENSIKVGIDETTYGEFTPAVFPVGSKWVFNDSPNHVLLNVAVGGDWPGQPDDSTPFPATMMVDWFRFDPA